MTADTECLAITNKNYVFGGGNTRVNFRLQEIRGDVSAEMGVGKYGRFPVQ